MLTVENSGGRLLAFTIKVNYADATSSLEDVNPVVWKDKFTYSKKIEDMTSVEIQILADVDAVEDNNMLTIKK